MGGSWNAHGTQFLARKWLIGADRARCALLEMLTDDQSDKR